LRNNLAITITSYRYSGFSLRATAHWNQSNSTVLTSEGEDRATANFSHARWVRLEGAAKENQTAGILIMSHPSNHTHLEKLRTWDKQYNGAIFINFNTVADSDWVLQPTLSYTRNYQLFIYDGSLSAEDADQLWGDYAIATK
tara:strand:+ start:29291 stop:29716 length:426 start_codon:yes stop_codon:yes gene_type:complete